MTVKHEQEYPLKLVHTSLQKQVKRKDNTILKLSFQVYGTVALALQAINTRKAANKLP